MSSTVHKVLGRERIKKICRKFGLDSKDEEIIDKILEKWEHLIGQSYKKMSVALELIKDNPKHMQITRAMFEINLQFTHERIK